MKTRHLVLAGIVAAALIVAGATVLNVLPTPTDHPVATMPASTVGGPSPNRHADTANAGTANADGSAAPAPPGKVGKRLTTEVQPPTAKATKAALPPSKPVPAFYQGPAPAPASATGKVVVGFPEHLTLAPDTEVGASAVSTSGSIVQATLTATTTQSLAQVIGYYQQALGRFGMVAKSLPAVGGSTALGFARGSNTVTLTVTPTTHGVEYSLFGTLVTHR